MAIAGHVKDFPLAELLFFLSSKQRTGRLVLKRRGMTIIFTLRFGRLIAAQMLPAEQRIGDRLVASGALSPAMLDEALHLQRHAAPGRPLGTLLVERGFIAREVLQHTLREQIADCLFKFLIAPGGTFTFRELTIDPSRIDVDVVVEREVLEALRRADEYVAQKIETGPLSLSLQVDPEVFQPLIVDNRDVIEAMRDGATTLDQIVAETAWGRDRVMNTLFQLQASGAIHLESELVGAAA